LSENATQKNWIVILTLLVLIAMVGIGPYLTAQIGPGAHSINLTLPIAINGSTTLAISSIVAIGALIVLIAGAVAVGGAVLSFLFRRIDRETTDVKTSEKFQTDMAALDKVDTEKINQLREGRSTAGVPDHQRPRWSTISTSLIVILFSVFLGMLINASFIPHGEYLVNGRTASTITVTLIWLVFLAVFVIVLRYRSLKSKASKEPVAWDTVWITGTGLLVVGVGLTLVLLLSGRPDVETTVNSALPVVGGLALFSLLILAWRVEPQSFADVEASDRAPIPWDFIWVFLSGLLVVGLGLAVTAYLNAPS
jgi:hypothetical protein